MDAVYIVLIVAAVVLAVAWMYRRRLTRGWFKGSKEGLEAGIEAAPSTETPAVEEKAAAEAPAGVRLRGDFQRARISGLAGRDRVRGQTAAPRRGGAAPGVELDGRFPDAEVRDLAGRDAIAGGEPPEATPPTNEEASNE